MTTQTTILSTSYCYQLFAFCRTVTAWNLRNPRCVTLREEQRHSGSWLLLSVRLMDTRSALREITAAASRLVFRAEPEMFGWCDKWWSFWNDVSGRHWSKYCSPWSSSALSVVARSAPQPHGGRGSQIRVQFVFAQTTPQKRAPAPLRLSTKLDAAAVWTQYPSSYRAIACSMPCICHNRTLAKSSKAHSPTCRSVFCRKYENSLFYVFTFIHRLWGFLVKTKVALQSSVSCARPPDDSRKVLFYTSFFQPDSNLMES